MKQKRQLAILLVLVVIAVGVWAWSYRGGIVAGTDGPNLIAKNDPPFTPDNPHIRKDEVDKARVAEYKSSGRNIFSEIAQPTKSDTPTVAANPVISVNTPCGVYGPCPVPPPPPCKLPPNIKFFGYGVVPNGTSRRAFLSDGETVHVVSEGEVLMNRFRILRIGNATLEFDEVSSKCTLGTAPLEEQSGTPGGPTG